MLSLPLILPHNEANLWPTTARRSQNTNQAQNRAPNAGGPTAATTPGGGINANVNTTNTTPGGGAGGNNATNRRHSAQNPRHPSNTMSAAAAAAAFGGMNMGPYRSPLAALAFDEALFSVRKANVRTFGAGWLKPPGVAKTYQMVLDEAVEKAEQEELARREAVMMEAAQQEARVRRERLVERRRRGRRRQRVQEAETLVETVVNEDGVEEQIRVRVEDGALVDEDGNVLDFVEEDEGEGDEGDDDDLDFDEDDEEFEDVEDDEFGDEEDDGEGERDLDDDVPEAEDVTFNEDSLIEGSMDDPDVDEVQQMLVLEEAEMTGALQEARDLDHDLDDDVPEAGSYQHTDSDAEDDEDDIDELDDSDDLLVNVELSGEVEMRDASNLRLSAASARLSGNSHSLLSDTGSSIPGSSFLDGSPTMGRGGAVRGGSSRLSAGVSGGRMTTTGSSFRDRLLRRPNGGR